MGVQPNQAVIVLSVFSFCVLGIGYFFIPSDEQKMNKYMKKYPKYFDQKPSFRPEVIEKMKEQDKSGQQFMDTIRSAANSDKFIFGQKDNKKD